MRGVRYMTCPTTLEADVDASIGGKTGDRVAADREEDDGAQRHQKHVAHVARHVGHDPGEDDDEGQQAARCCVHGEPETGGDQAALLGHADAQHHRQHQAQRQPHRRDRLTLDQDVGVANRAFVDQARIGQEQLVHAFIMRARPVDYHRNQSRSREALRTPRRYAIRAA